MNFEPTNSQISLTNSNDSSSCSSNLNSNSNNNNNNSIIENIRNIFTIEEDQYVDPAKKYLNENGFESYHELTTGTFKFNLELY